MLVNHLSFSRSQTDRQTDRQSVWRIWRQEIRWWRISISSPRNLSQKVPSLSFHSITHFLMFCLSSSVLFLPLSFNFIKTTIFLLTPPLSIHAEVLRESKREMANATRGNDHYFTFTFTFPLIITCCINLLYVFHRHRKRNRSITTWSMS